MYVFATITLPFVPAQTIYSSTDTPIPILDDAVTTDAINVPDDQTISGMDVAIAVLHPRISDLVFHLISPDGTRELLMENRGGTDPSGAGGVATVTTNTALASDFDTVAPGDYAAGQPVGGWIVAGNQVSVQTDPVNAYTGNSNLLALANGTLYTTLATVPGQTYTLTFAYHGPGIQGWWRAESNVVDSAYGDNGILVSGAGYMNGEVGSAFNFDGVNSYVQISDQPNLRMTNGMTLEAWVYPTSLGGYVNPAGKWDGFNFNGNQRSYDFTITPSGQVWFAVTSGGTGPSTFLAASANVLQVNQWALLDGTL